MGRTGNARTVKQATASRKVTPDSPSTLHVGGLAEAPLALPVSLCAGCAFNHPKPKGVALPNAVSPFLTPAELAAFIGKRLSTIYSEKSRGQLPLPLARPGNPRWDPCVVARWLYTGVTNINAQPLQGGTR